MSKSSNIVERNPQQEMLDQIAEAKAIGDNAQKEFLERILKDYVNAPQEPTEQKIHKIKERIASASKPEEIVYSLIPHEMAKVSIFFPMSDKELSSDRRIMANMVAESKWGRAIIRGIKLSIFEEDVFLALLTLAKKEIKPSNTELVLETTFPKIAKLLYSTSSGHNKKTYQQISQAIKNLGLIQFTIALYIKDGANKKIGPDNTASAIISGSQLDLIGKTARIIFNPEFFAYCGKSNLTSINFSLRRKLKKAGSKALLRFLATHRKPSKMQMITVLDAINFNTKKPLFRLREILKEYIAELKLHGVLGPKTKLYQDDLVYFDIVTKKNHAKRSS